MKTALKHFFMNQNQYGKDKPSRSISETYSVWRDAQDDDNTSYKVKSPLTDTTMTIFLVLADSPDIRELKHARFRDAEGNRKWTVFTFNSPSHNHIHIAKYLFSIRDE